MNSVKNTVFVFDLHDVLVKKNYRTMFLLTIRYLIRPTLLITLMRPSCMAQIIRLLRISRVPEHYIIELAKYYPCLTSYIQPITTIMNQQIPIDTTIEIVRTLKQKGHTLYLFSNIGEQTFNAFKNLFPDLIALFDNACIATADDNWIQKPYGTSFKKFITCSNTEPQNCIFIDNSKKNIYAAQTFGFKTILYRSSHRLKTDLKFFIDA